jgi:hypothetical protein
MRPQLTREPEAVAGQRTAPDLFSRNPLATPSSHSVSLIYAGRGRSGAGHKPSVPEVVRAREVFDAACDVAKVSGSEAARAERRKRPPPVPCKTLLRTRSSEGGLTPGFWIPLHRVGLQAPDRYSVIGPQRVQHRFVKSGHLITNTAEACKAVADLTPSLYHPRTGQATVTPRFFAPQLLETVRHQTHPAPPARRRWAVPTIVP